MIALAPGILPALVALAAKEAPRECCGLLLGQGERIEGVLAAPNVHPDPCTRFEIDPHALIAAHRDARQGGPQIVGYFHSHPSGAAQPSATDAAMASGDGRVWAIVAGDTVTFWKDAPGGFHPLPYAPSGA